MTSAEIRAAVQQSENFESAHDRHNAAPLRRNPKPIVLRAADPARFWTAVAKTDTCWLWTGTISPDGYGKFSTAGKPVFAHRVAYTLTYGAIPDGLYLDHLCRVRSCVNPEHLEVVTHAENLRRQARAQQTECLRGHAFDTLNTVRKANGTRECRACQFIRNAKRTRPGWLDSELESLRFAPMTKAQVVRLHPTLERAA